MVATVVTEDEVLRAHQLRVLRSAGVDLVDEHVRHLLATGRLSAGSVVAGYARLLRDLRVTPGKGNGEAPTSRPTSARTT